MDIEISIECVDNPNGFPGVVVYDDETFPLSSPQISVECVDNPNGFPGVVVYDDETFPMSSRKTASDEEHGSGSSVQPFHDVNDDAATDPPETDSNTRESLQKD